MSWDSHNPVDGANPLAELGDPEIHPSELRCVPCNAKFHFNGKRTIAFCPYCGGPGATA